MAHVIAIGPAANGAGALARRFDASEVRRGERFPLHLLNQPIYTYADADHGLIDGAVFAISYGTNPEILVQLEARERDGMRQWHVAFTRLSAAEVTVRLKDQEIWKVAPIAANEYDPRGPYFATNEPDRPQSAN